MVTLGDAFGLWVAADPSRDFFEARPEWSIGSGVKILRSYQSSLLDDPQGKPLPWPGWPVHVALLFDLSEDVGVQIREAEARLRRRQHEAAADLASRVIRPDARPQPQKFAAYIRALDGHEGGASQLEIGRVPFPEIGPRMDADAVRAAERERKNAAHAIRAARQLAGGGYRDLLFWRETGKTSPGSISGKDVLWLEFRERIGRVRFPVSLFFSIVSDLTPRPLGGTIPHMTNAGAGGQPRPALFEPGGGCP